MTTFHDRNQAGDADEICNGRTAWTTVTRYDGLTEGQEAFAQAYVQLGNGAEAYRVAYGADVRRKHLSERGRRLRKRPKVAARIAQLRGEGYLGAVVETGTANGSLLPRGGAVLGQEVAAPGSLAAKAGAAVLAPPVTYRGARGARVVRNVEPDAVSVGDIEAVAAIAFDEKASDLVRLIALRAVTAALGRLRREGGTCHVTVTVGGVAGAPRSAGPS